MILATVLLFMAAIVAIILPLHLLARLDLRLEERRTAQAFLSATAAGAAWEALQRLADDDTPLLDHLQEDWARRQAYSLPSGVEIEIQIRDENRRLNVNSLALRPAEETRRAPADMAADLLATAQWPDPAGTVQALRDWVDADTEGTREAAYYRLAGLPLVPPNAAFESPAELDAILAAHADAPRARPEHLTVLPLRDNRPTPLNVNTASRDALLATLGAGRLGAVESLCRRREAGPVTALSQAFDAKTLAALGPYLATDSRYFTLTSRASQHGRQASVHAWIFRNDRGDLEILRWIQ